MWEPGTSVECFARSTNEKSAVPKREKIPKIPRTIPRSPTRFAMNAFLPAATAKSLS